MTRYRVCTERRAHRIREALKGAAQIRRRRRHVDPHRARDEDHDAASLTLTSSAATHAAVVTSTSRTSTRTRSPSFTTMGVLFAAAPGRSVAGRTVTGTNATLGSTLDVRVNRF